MEIKFEISKELECKQLLWSKLEGNYNSNSGSNNNNNNNNSNNNNNNNKR